MRIASTVYKHSLFIAVLLLSAGAWAKSGIEKTKKINESFSVKSDDTFFLEGGEGDVTIETWDQNKVEVDITITVRAEDEAGAIEFLENANATIEKVSGGVKTDMKLCVSIMSNNSRMKVKFKGGKWIKIQDYTITVNVKIPKSNNVNIDCSYGHINVASIDGDATAKIYDSKVKFHDVGGTSMLNVQYGSLEVGALRTPKKVKLYEVDFTGGDLGSGAIETSYSTIQLGNLKNITLKSYEDDIFFKDLEKLEGNASYSKFKGEEAKNVNIRLYECTFDVDEVGDMKLHSQYSKMDIDKLGSIFFDSSYEDEYNLGQCGSFEGKGQYVRYQAASLTDKFAVDCYECKFDIRAVEKSTSKVELLGSYGNMNLTLDPGLVYDLDIDVQYPDISYPKEDFESRVNLDDDKAEAFLKHRNSAAKRALLKFHGYEMKVSVGK